MAAHRASPSEAPDLATTAYRYVREIGRGGMGSVHEVEHLALGKRFVMKVLHEKLAHREDFALRMRSEWRILAKLEHPAIVQVTDAGQTREGLPFFVMERLEGQTVADALRAHGPWSALAAAELMLTVLSGLEAAHAAGAIHRDIKPQNLFLTSRGPKILDFGIVKSKKQRAAFVTRSGVAIGTPRYMAPEQAAGRTVDGRTDIYACALVLFEMIAGRDPYAHLSDQGALVHAQINEPAPRLDDISLDAPPPLGDLLQRWLAKDAADRPASARLARIELEALLPLLRTGEPPISQAVTSQQGIARGPNESTAGRTAEASLLPTTATSSIRAAGATETATAPTPSPAPAESARSPSVTPPPLAGAENTARRASPNRWLWAAAAVLSAVAAALGVLVLRPDWAPRGEAVKAELWTEPAFHFPETGPETGPETVPETSPETGPPASQGAPLQAPEPSPGAPPGPPLPSTGEAAEPAGPPPEPQGSRRPSNPLGPPRPVARQEPAEAPAKPKTPAAARGTPSARPPAAEDALVAAPPGADLPGSGLW